MLKRKKFGKCRDERREYEETHRKTKQRNKCASWNSESADKVRQNSTLISPTSFLDNIFFGLRSFYWRH